MFLNRISQVTSRICGALIGALTGFLGGAILGAAYYARLLSKTYIIGTLFGLVFGALWGSIHHTSQGIYKGATEGLKAGFFYPKEVYADYFSNINENKKLHDYIKRYNDQQKPSLKLLSKNELIKLQELSREDQELTKELIFYRYYLNIACPLTNHYISNHRDPLTIKVFDKKNQPVIKIYHRKKFLEQLQNNIDYDYQTKDSDTDCIIKEDNILSAGYPPRITEFIAKVRELLKLKPAKNPEPEVSEITERKPSSPTKYSTIKATRWGQVNKKHSTTNNLTSSHSINRNFLG